MQRIQQQRRCLAGQLDNCGFARLSFARPSFAEFGMPLGRVNQRREGAAAREQVGVRAGLDDAAIFEDQNAVRLVRAGLRGGATRE